MVEPSGTASEKFALMLHDRLVDLETRLAEMTAPRVDDRVSLLGGRDTGDTGRVFVRVRTSTAVDVAPWMRAALTVLARTDGGTRWDAWCCQHWSLGHRLAYVTECLVERRGERPVAATRVAHACLDACPAGVEARVEACGVRCHAWFAESLAAAATVDAHHAWDPVRCVAVSTPNAAAASRPHAPDPDDAWVMLHGWLASQVDVADVWHPRALNAHAASARLLAVVAHAASSAATDG